MTDTTTENPVGLKGLAFIEFSAELDSGLGEIFEEFGFSSRHQHTGKSVTTWQQNDILFLWHHGEDGFQETFREAHGPSACGMGFWVEDADKAWKAAVERGARPFDQTESTTTPYDLPAVYGIGNSLIYFVDDPKTFFKNEFIPRDEPVTNEEKGFWGIDHLTNNVYKGELDKWSDFYKDIFGFTEVRHFDIRGEETGLLSYALRSPDGSFCIPINEGTEEKSQIEEYLREYNGPGIQHIALISDDLLSSLQSMEDGNISFLDIDDQYYEEVFDRVPNVTEDHDEIKRLQVLVDGDEDGYLLQIFTRNLIGPIFIELIQRKNHLAFGEGNFGALFRSIERDQKRRGVL